ncbi:MAG: 4Fe-4S binding protein, partial [Mobilitalea sp.]
LDTFALINDMRFLDLAGDCAGRTYSCTKGTALCARVCPTGAISGKVKEAHIIDQSKCIKCGACMEKCKFVAISKK